MKRLTICLLLVISLPLAAADLLRIYFIDVEGGASTLVVTAAGETVLMDTGYAGRGDRDPRRIRRVLTEEAGAARIDYLITSHYHGDHVGGLPALAKMVRVGRFLDYGEPPEPERATYLAAVGDRRQVVEPGYVLPLDGGKLTIVAAAGRFIEKPLGKGLANPLCADFKRQKEDTGENSRSIGYVLQIAGFDFLNLGDLSWNLQHELACPRNLLPEIDLFQVTHHGVRDDVLPQQMWAVKPTVAVMNNGPHKGAGPVAVETVMRSPGLADLWQLHRAVENDDAHNTGQARTANLGETDGCEGHWIRATLHDDGTFTVYNSRNGYEKSYPVKQRPIAGESQETSRMKPPVAKVRPKKLEIHGDVRTDNYYWLRERDNPEVIAYLEAENAYTKAMMAHTEKLQEKLFQEFKTRIKQTDMSVPFSKDGYLYYSRTEEGREYPVYCRKRAAEGAAEEVLVDVNRLAEGHDFTSVRRPEVSPDTKQMAYAADTVGRRFYDIHFRNLETGEEHPEVIERVTPNFVWANDNRTLFYTKQDPETLRYHRVYRHVLGTDPAADVLVYEETDPTFECEVSRSKSGRYILLASNQTVSNEVRFLDASEPAGEFRVIAPRRRDHEYSVDEGGGFFYIRTNRGAKNFRLMKAPVARPGEENWSEVIPHRADVFLDDFELFKNYLVAGERQAGLLQLRIMPTGGGEEHYIDFGEPAYAAFTGENHEFDTPVLRFEYSSMATPDSVYDYNMVTREKKLLKRKEVLGGFDRDNYRTERLYATARDGARVPISLVYRKGLFYQDGSSPLLQLGYGSYGYSEDADFSPYIVSLLDRGFVFAKAHIRGGQEMGRQWYDDGKLLKKKNTFTDFIDCAEFLVREKYAAPDKLFAQGGSAGGLLMGAVTNMRPDLWRGVFAAVPFVDVVTTMLDDSIPLTTSEYDEWGDPHKKAYYDYMLSYSPYDNVEAKDYPNLLVLAGLHDSQVQYWEPAKWVAKLRALKRDDNLLLLRTQMEAGHGGVSGRYKSYRERALIYAFFIDLAGAPE